ncbi:hypothetical protein GLOTRDRAFT_72373 [Gloeophyllum trabeum ATCC 11539]|uniref:FUN14-domain-containing protein n=1 Tax=Gloeophyllum trabeum (strain ATCC 11539 / FP-39264 / Madison 617) TaxID=670483 RepID=S7QEH2_GLOTA|nr:uncharacterized protein GLOTRDRAFT_72373 [Gloeophyllum trabeum ATCC 11539]EPQ58211.1 hypothetical protein GLOTRDRAFT_72373 [Gloeophyllum trabeum ATCC 11539]
MSLSLAASLSRPFRASPLGIKHSLAQSCSKRPLCTFSPRFNPPFATHASRPTSLTKSARPLIAATLGIGGVGLGLSVFSKPIYCEPPTPKTADLPPNVAEASSTDPYPPPPKSVLNVYELTFGTVAGICAGVFVKKGARFVAFMLGGVFVLLQYLGSLSVLRVNWSRVGSRFENLFYTTDATGVKKPPSVYSLWKWLVDFLTADFQPRASFLAGLALGLRIG